MCAEERSQAKNGASRTLGSALYILFSSDSRYVELFIGGFSILYGVLGCLAAAELIPRSDTFDKALHSVHPSVWVISFSISGVIQIVSAMSDSNQWRSTAATVAVIVWVGAAYATTRFAFLSQTGMISCYCAAAAMLVLSRLVLARRKATPF